MKDVWKLVNWMSREEIVAVLEAYGFACYDSETTAQLREALVVNIQDKTIPLNAVEK